MDILKNDTPTSFHEIKRVRDLLKTEKNPTTSFDLAWLLLRSEKKELIKEGIQILESLQQTGNPSERRSYMLYIAVGNFKIKNYEYAFSVINALIEKEPRNNQFLSVKQEMVDKCKNVAINSAAVAGGVLAAAGLLFALIKARN